MTKTLLLSFFMLTINILSGQQLIPSSPISLELEANFEPKLLEQSSDNHLLILGQQRIGGDLRALVSKVNTKGAIVSSISLGTPESADRCTDIISESDHANWVLVNSFEKKNILNLYQIDNDLEILSQIIIDIANITSAIAIGKVTAEKIWVLATYSENSIRTYPVLIIHDRLSGNNDMTAYDHNNPSEFSEQQISDYGVTEDSPEGHKSAAQAFIYESKFQLFKNANNFIDTGSDMLIVGMENTDNFGDFWAVNIRYNGSVKWEQLYEKHEDPGVDALQSIIPLKNGDTFLAGMNYNKKDNLNYNYNSIVVNDKGAIIHQHLYDTGHDEYLNGSFLIQNNILLAGHLNLEPDKRWVGDNIETSNLYFVLTDLEGKQIKELQIETETYNQMVGSFKSEMNQVTVLFKRSDDQENWKYYLQNIRVSKDRP